MITVLLQTYNSLLNVSESQLRYEGQVYCTVHTKFHCFLWQPWEKSKEETEELLISIYAPPPKKNTVKMNEGHKRRLFFFIIYYPHFALFSLPVAGNMIQCCAANV